jgi:hypothetical protein
MALIITPAILMIRIERLINKVSVDDSESAITLCRKYIEDLENKSISIININDARLLAEALFEIELLVTLGLMRCGEELLKTINDKIIKILVDYNIFRNRLMNDVPNEDSIGALAMLPTDCLRDIVDKLQVEYVW